MLQLFNEGRYTCQHFLLSCIKYYKHKGGNKMVKPNIVQAASGIATVTNPNGANIYNNSNEQANIWGIVSTGMYLPFLRRYPDENGNWYEVTLLDGVTIHAHQLKRF